MKHHFKLVINFLASLFVMLSGTMQAAQADEVWLDFSVPQADVTIATPKVASNCEAASTASMSQTKRYPSGSLKKYESAVQTTSDTKLSVVSGANLSSPTLIAMANSTDAIAQKRLEKDSENAAKLIALDFSVPNADEESASVAAEFSGETKLSTPKATPPSVKAKVPPPSTSAIKTPATKPISGKTSKQQVTALRRAIVGQESGGKFNIVNPHSGALGYGQLMPENVAPWSRAALGREVSVPEFLNNPNLQIKVIDYKLSQYFDRALQVTGGDEATAVKRVAAAWYSGNPKLYTSTTPQFYNGYPYPSIAAYSQSVLRRYQQQRQG